MWFPVPHVGLDPRSFPRDANACRARVRSIFKSPSAGGGCWDRLAILRGLAPRRAPAVDGGTTQPHDARAFASEQTPQPDGLGEAIGARTPRGNVAAIRTGHFLVASDVRRGPRHPFRGDFECKGSGAAHFRAKPARTFFASKQVLLFSCRTNETNPSLDMRLSRPIPDRPTP